MAISAAYFNPVMDSDDDVSDNIKADKHALRQQVFAARCAMSSAARQTAANSICQQIMQLPSFLAARCVAAFAPMEYEVDIWQIIDECCRQNKTVGLPRMKPNRQLSFHMLGERNLLEVGAKNILQPPAEWPLISPTQFDFLLIPAVAIDKQKTRLGYGGGFYDTFITAINNAAVSCAPVFRCQKIAQVPTEAHDKQVDFIFSE